jgi:hypothetical protein
MREIKRLDEINIRNEKDVDIVLDLVKYEKQCKDLRRRNHSILGSLFEREFTLLVASFFSLHKELVRYTPILLYMVFLLEVAKS